MNIQWMHQRLIITNCVYTCTDDLFANFYISKKTRYLYYQRQQVRVQHQVVRQNHAITPLDHIEILCTLQGDDIICQPCFDGIEIVYEDDLFLIVNKACGMLVHSDGTGFETTLYDLVKGYYIEQNINANVRAIHRLDYDTTGAVIFCKIAFLQPLLDHMLMEKEIKRQYIALCRGVIQKKTLRIHACIARDRHLNKMRICTNGKEATTDITVHKKYRDYTYIQCDLHQGRTHQIRVHLASIGHPLLSDHIYGVMSSSIARCALHAHRVTLFHPLLQKVIQIECPIPNDIKRLL